MLLILFKAMYSIALYLRHWDRLFFKLLVVLLMGRMANHASNQERLITFTKKRYLWARKTMVRNVYYNTPTMGVYI